MGKRTKRIIQLLLTFSISFIACSGIFANAQNAGSQQFISNLRASGRDIDTLLTKPSISRYELTRLLNSVSCQDCTTPNIETIDTYTPTWLSGFQALPDNNFNDISPYDTLYNEENYYYCVATVGDQGFMNGYPIQTSPICGGNFCGNNNTTNAEFIQVLINIAAPLIATEFSTNRSQIGIWSNSLSPSEKQSKGRNTTDQAITNIGQLKCGEEDCTLSSRDEVTTYLKFCRFNLEACAMRPYPGIQQGARPVSELNLLEKADILTASSSSSFNLLQPSLSIHTLTTPSTAINAFANVFDIIQCTQDNDYDCDGLDNPYDNCPHTYNPSQGNYDGDSYGDVCDTDTDNDGIKNPSGIVDESGNIVISVISGDRDQCLFDRTNTECNNSPLIGLAIEITSLQQEPNNPYTAWQTTLQATSNTTTDETVWTTSDGQTYHGSTMQHTFTTPGTHYIYASLNKSTNTAQAIATVYIPDTSPFDIFAASIDTYDATSVSLIVPTPPSGHRMQQLINGEDALNQGNTIAVDPEKKVNKISLLYKDELDQTLSLNELTHYVISGDETAILSLVTSENQVTIGSPFSLQSLLNGIDSDQILSFQWQVNQQEVPGDQASLTYTIPQAGTYIMQQRITLVDGNILQATMTVQAYDTKHRNSIGYSTVPVTFTNNQTGTTITTITDTQSFGPSTHVIRDNKETNTLFNQTPISRIITNRSPQQIGEHIRSYDMYDQYCLALRSSSTVIKTTTNKCLEYFLNPDLSTLSCDQDQDGIPDMCDDDIDGDGVPNLVGLLIGEKFDCSVDSSLIDREWVQQTNISERIGFNDLSCQLDNCPFDSNTDQTDNNNDGQGNVCQGMAQGLANGQSYNTTENRSGTIQTGFIIINDDDDNDGIKNSDDACPTIPENYNGQYDQDGCPELEENPNCNIDPIPLPLPEEPDEDYCTFPYPEECICQGLTAQQCCAQHNLDCPEDGDDPGEDDNECQYPYGVECQCVGLTQQECCEEFNLNCPDDPPGDPEDPTEPIDPDDDYCVEPYPEDCRCVGLTQEECCAEFGDDCYPEEDYCTFPYPEECQCVGLSEEQCCTQHGLDCPGEPDDPGEDDNECLEVPYGAECLCFGLSQEECCAEFGDDCYPEEDYCTFPYPEECQCVGLSEEQCCTQHGLDCPGEPDDPGEDDNECLEVPYGAECLCFGLSQSECCAQQGLDCPPVDPDDPGEDENGCTYPYGVECLCFGLSQTQCCQQFGFDCDDDYCQEPYPDECLCVGLTTEECCEEYGLDCPGDPDDPGENENHCQEEPYGAECLCVGLSQEQCCDTYGLDCSDDYCQEPYPDECLCDGLTAEECCAEHGLDCPGDPDDPSEDENECLETPYGSECLCFGLTAEECCQQQNLDCPDEPPVILPPVDEDGPVIDVINCNICPCQFVDFESDLNEDTILKTKLFDISKKRIFDDSLPHVIHW